MMWELNGRFIILTVADQAIGVGGGLPPTPLAENVAPPGTKFQAVHESLPAGSCKHIFFINMRNSLFRFLILLDELQLIYEIWCPLNFRSPHLNFRHPPPPHATKTKSATAS